jgi:SAM-dependent methyltransferase
MSDFDVYADSYVAAVERSIAFCRQDLDYYTKRKADIIVEASNRLLGDPTSLRFLDVGCGIGATDAVLATRVGELHGVDVAIEAVARAADQNPSVKYQTYDGEALPYDDGSMDVAFAICVVHHVDPAQRCEFAAELRRVVRKTGLVFVFEHNPYNPLTRLAVDRCPFDCGVELLTRRSTARLLTQAGLEPVEARYFTFVPVDHPLVGRVERLLRWLPAGAQHYVAARR